ncbi:MAG: PLP-dependent aminotransferase family protein [Solirubrobacterales bacterium]
MILINLDEKIRIPKYKQIIQQIIDKINKGVLKPGDRLPSTRNLSESLEINRITVSSAYQELWALGYIDLNAGACAVVRNRNQLMKTTSLEPGVINWSELASSESNCTLDYYINSQPCKNNNLIDFSTLNMENNLLPVESFRTSLNEIIKQKGSDLFSYGNSLGYLPLREYLSNHLETHGISVSPDEILITNGTQQALDLILRMAACKGKSIVVEAPTYKEIIPLIKYYKFNPIEVPMEPYGMNLDVLEEVINRYKPALIYTMPNFHNPTGITTNQAHREKLLYIAEKYKIPIIEDGFQEEMKYFGKTVLPIKSMDKNKAVIYCGTFSKVLFPGIRVGWIAADRECILRVAAIRHYSEISLSMILQAGLFEFCSNGYYEKHLNKVHRTFRKRMNIAINSMNRHLDKNYVSWEEPSGGFLIWIKFKRNPLINLEEVLKENGIRASLGHNYFINGTKNTFLRLSISSLSEDDIEEGIRRFGNVIKQIYK